MDLTDMLVAASRGRNDMLPSSHAYNAVTHPRNQWRDIMLTGYDKAKRKHVKIRSSRFSGMATPHEGGEFEYRGRLYRFEGGQVHCVGMAQEANPQRFTIR